VNNKETPLDTSRLLLQFLFSTLRVVIAFPLPEDSTREFVGRPEFVAFTAPFMNIALSHNGQRPCCTHRIRSRPHLGAQGHEYRAQTSNSISVANIIPSSGLGLSKIEQKSFWIFFPIAQLWAGIYSNRGWWAHNKSCSRLCQQTRLLMAALWPLVICRVRPKAVQRLRQNLSVRRWRHFSHSSYLRQGLHMTQSICLAVSTTST